MPLPPMRPHRHAASAVRLEGVDALRGFAMVWMTAFHFCFDLNHFGYLQQDFYNAPLWTWQRTCILGLFLFTAGLGQAIALQRGQSWQLFWRRWVQVAGCALLVTAGSYWMYPKSFIYFGTLHGIALMLVVVRLTAAWGRWLWFAGGSAVALKYIAYYSIMTRAGVELDQWLNGPALNWLGFITTKPLTEDYVPLIPWLGVMWWGMATGQWLLAHRAAWLAAQAPRPLAWLGRWSLSYYMLHQPVMIAGLVLAGFLGMKPL